MNVNYLLRSGIKSGSAISWSASYRRRGPAAPGRDRDVPAAGDGQRGHARRVPRAAGRARARQPARGRTQLRHGDLCALLLTRTAPRSGRAAAGVGNENTLAGFPTEAK